MSKWGHSISGGVPTMGQLLCCGGCDDHWHTHLLTRSLPYQLHTQTRPMRIDCRTDSPGLSCHRSLFHIVSAAEGGVVVVATPCPRPGTPIHIPAMPLVRKCTVTMLSAIGPTLDAVFISNCRSETLIKRWLHFSGFPRLVRLVWI